MKMNDKIKDIKKSKSRIHDESSTPSTYSTKGQR